MNDTILLIISMAACLFGGILRKYCGDKFKNKQVMYYFFNILSSLVAVVTLLSLSKIGKISSFTFCLGIGFGIVIALQQIFTLKAYETGPFAYTAVVTSLSTIIPTLSGYFIWGETIEKIQILGIVMMFVCIICSVDFKKESAKSSAKWYVCVFFAFLSTGLIGVMQKWHQSSDFKNELNGFLVLAFLVSFTYSLVLFAVSYFKTIDDRKEFISSNLKWFLILDTAICGMCVALNHKLNLYLSGVIDSAIFFPVVNGGNLILTAIASVILFREKLSIQKWIGMAIGVISVILLCNPF